MSPQVQSEAWAEIMSKPGKASEVERHEDPALSVKLEGISKSWETRDPKAEWSVMTAKGELVYVGRYEEGVVLRLNDNSRQIVYLTNDMANQLGKLLHKKGK